MRAEEEGRPQRREKEGVICDDGGQEWRRSKRDDDGVLELKAGQDRK